MKKRWAEAHPIMAEPPAEAEMEKASDFIRSSQHLPHLRKDSAISS